MINTDNKNLPNQLKEITIEIDGTLKKGRLPIPGLKLATLALGEAPVDSNARMSSRGQYYSISYPNSTVTATANIDWSRGNTQKAGITQATTLSFTNVKPGGRYILEIQQDETGSRAITWPSTVIWPGGSAPTASGAFKVDLYAFYNNGSSTFGSSSLNY